MNTHNLPKPPFGRGDGPFSFSFSKKKTLTRRVGRWEIGPLEIGLWKIELWKIGSWEMGQKGGSSRREFGQLRGSLSGEGVATGRKLKS